MKGFTLLEMMVVMSIIAIAALTTLPSMTAMYDVHQAKRWARQLQSMLKYARITAISQSTPVTVAPIDGDWCVGYEAFKGGTGRGYLSDPAAHLKKIQHPRQSQCTIGWRDFSGKPYLRFLPTGQTNGQNGSFKVFYAGDLLVKLVVSRTGRVRWVETQ